MHDHQPIKRKIDSRIVALWKPCHWLSSYLSPRHYYEDTHDSTTGFSDSGCICMGTSWWSLQPKLNDASGAFGAMRDTEEFIHSESLVLYLVPRRQRHFSILVNRFCPFAKWEKKKGWPFRCVLRGGKWIMKFLTAKIHDTLQSFAIGPQIQSLLGLEQTRI